VRGEYDWPSPLSSEGFSDYATTIGDSEASVMDLERAREVAGACDPEVVGERIAEA